MIHFRYVDRFANSIKSKLMESEKYDKLILEMSSKREESSVEELALSVKLNNLSKRSKELELDIEKEISAKYNKRPVNLMSTL